MSELLTTEVGEVAEGSLGGGMRDMNEELRKLNDEMIKEIELLRLEKTELQALLNETNKKLREREAEAEYWKRQSEIARQNEVNAKQTIGTLKAALKVVL
jgi:regulator of replication initiation timing